MRKILTIAIAEIMESMRNKVLFMLLILFFLSSIISIYVGSSTIRTELTAYDLAVQIHKGLDSSSLPLRPSLSVLSVMKNSIEYVLMIGALLSIFLGFDSVSEDYRRKTLHILLSRNVYRDQYLTGKIMGGFLIIFTLNISSFLVDVGGLYFIGTNSIGWRPLENIVLFHAVAVLYMLLFLLLAILFSILFLQSLPAFLSSVSLWLGTGYVIPEISKSVRTFLLSGDSAMQTVQTTAITTPLSDAIDTISPATHFRILGDYLFSITGENTINFPFHSLLFLIVITLLTGTAAYLTFNSRELNSYA